MELVIVLVVVTIVAIFYQKVNANRVYCSGDKLPLDKNKDYEFVWLASFEAKASAEACVDEVKQMIDLSGEISPSPNGKKWMVHWSNISKADAKNISEIEATIKSKCALKGGAFIYSTVNAPDSPKTTFE